MKNLFCAVCIAVLISSCIDNPKKAVADFRIFVSDTERFDSIPAKMHGYLLFTGKADQGKAVFFTGSGRPENNYRYDSDTGAVADLEKKVYFYYSNRGPDTIVCIATLSDKVDEANQDKKIKPIIIY